MNLMSALHPALPPGDFDILALLQHEPPLDWRPTEVGDTVWGVVSTVDEGRRADYTFPILYLIDNSGALIRVRCAAVMLRNPVRDQRIGVGSVVSFRLDGKKISAAGREYRTFTVRSLS